MDLAQTIISALGAVIILSIAYRLLPHRSVPKQKPILAMFPKYVLQNSDRAEVVNILEKLGFRQRKESNVYVRGYYFGDFSASWARLNAVIDIENVYLHSPLLVILFDTGDLWKIASTLSGQNSSD
jgi:hypothetical protein